jgi:hypothetical protein
LCLVAGFFELTLLLFVERLLRRLFVERNIAIFFESLDGLLLGSHDVLQRGFLTLVLLSHKLGLADLRFEDRFNLVG